MKCLIRKAGFRAGDIEYDDTEYQAEVLSLGRDSRCDVLIEGQAVLPEHALISLRRNGRARIKALGGARIEVNGARKRRAILKVGDQISIANRHFFSVIDAPYGFDLALSWRSEKTGLERNMAFIAGATSLREAGWRWRKWIVSATLAVIVFGLVLPLAWVLWSPPAEGWARYWPLKDDFWSSGPLHKAHRLPQLIDDCGACHQQGFAHVADSVCTGCHQTASHFSEHARLEPFQEDRCSACHREHNEPERLTRSDEALCVNCHSQIDSDTETMHSIRKIVSFQRHTEFKLAMLLPADSGEQPVWRTQRTDWNPSVVEQSNLTFSHSVHLDKAGIDGPEGNTVMDCSDCHREQQNGKRMQPVNMEAHCAHCHSLAFEASDPERQVVHGEPARVLLDLEEYYSRLYARQGGPVVSVLEPSKPARRPGQPDKKFYAAMQAWADQRAYETAQNLLEQNACTTCHQVTRFDDRQGADRWQVLPVRLNQRWYPLADFDHASHRQSACQDCHEAQGSDQASEVLIPGLDNCRRCHGDENSSTSVASSCVSCHQYHASYQETRHD